MTWFLQNAPEPTSVFYSIIDKIPWMFDTVYNAINLPIVWWMILILLIVLFLTKL